MTAIPPSPFLSATCNVPLQAGDATAAQPTPPTSAAVAAFKVEIVQKDIDAKLMASIAGVGAITGIQTTGVLPGYESAPSIPLAPSPAAGEFQSSPAASLDDISDVHEIFHHVRKLIYEDEHRFVMDQAFEDRLFEAIQEPLPLFLQPGFRR